MLKLNLALVLEKVRAQEAQLRTLWGQVKSPANGPREAVAELDLGSDIAVEAIDQTHVRLSSALNRTRRDPLQEAEAALKSFREASDQERHAADRLEKELKKVREQLKKPEAPPGGK